MAPKRPPDQGKVATLSHQERPLLADGCLASLVVPSPGSRARQAAAALVTRVWGARASITWSPGPGQAAPPEFTGPQGPQGLRPGPECDELPGAHGGAGGRHSEEELTSPVGVGRPQQERFLHTQWALGCGLSGAMVASPRASGKPKASLLDLKAITCLLLQPGVLPVFLVKVICGFPSGESRAARPASRARSG